MSKALIDKSRMTGPVIRPATERVYLVGSSSSALVKIGRSVNVQRRLSELQHHSPVQLELIWSTPGGTALETALHRSFSDYRKHGEWFDFGVNNPLRLVRAVTYTHKFMGYGTGTGRMLYCSGCGELGKHSPWPGDSFICSRCLPLTPKEALKRWQQDEQQLPKGRKVSRAGSIIWTWSNSDANSDQS